MAFLSAFESLPVLGSRRGCITRRRCGCILILSSRVRLLTSQLNLNVLWKDAVYMNISPPLVTIEEGFSLLLASLRCLAYWIIELFCSFEHAFKTGTTYSLSVWILYIKQYSLQYLGSVDCSATIIPLITAIKITSFTKKRNAFWILYLFLWWQFWCTNYLAFSSRTREATNICIGKWNFKAGLHKKNAISASVNSVIFMQWE